jgi:hypothetical protein
MRGGPGDIRTDGPVAQDSCPCRKLKLERIDGVIRPGSGPNARGRAPSPLAGQERPCAMTSASEPRCSISDTTEAGGEDVVR